MRSIGSADRGWKYTIIRLDTGGYFLCYNLGMGYNTTITILNDALSEIKDNPQEFVEKMTAAIARGREQEIGVGNHANVARVMATAHADVSRLYYNHGNLTTDLSRLNSIENLSDWDLEVLQSRATIAQDLANRFAQRVEQEISRREQECAAPAIS